MKYYVHGRGFFAGYLSITPEGKRLWSDKIQYFNSISEIPEIPSYILYEILDENHNLIYSND